MPSKKDKISNLDLRHLIWKHGIRFKGPVPPKRWPEEHKNNFSPVRDINFIRYDDYMADRALSRDQREALKKKVHCLTRKADELLEDGGTTESTWRELEQSILARFDENVICENCNDELWRPDHKYEASARDIGEQDILDEKRRERRICSCKQKRSLSRTKNSDGETCKIFAHELDKIVSHVPDDNLQSYSIPRKPDRVVGLHAPLGISPSDMYFPVTRKRILLPFLVVEAKKEGDGPGFRAIQCQTAFPIRRFLKAQDHLWSHNRPSEPCLVWFFAFQGEEWRVHACTYTDGKVKIYDLWLGTIQSQDGTLQLLLIVDFIWSWARDVYRPTVRKLLSETLPNFRDLSPASTARYRPLFSLSSISSPPISQNEDHMQIDEPEDGSQNTQEDDWIIGRQFLVTQDQQKPTLLDASSHEFLRWAIGHQLAPQWAHTGSIRHSNIIHFEVKVFQISTPDAFEMSMFVNMDDRLILEGLLSSTFILLPNQLHDLFKTWMGNVRPTPTFDMSSGPLRVSFSFRTYCDRSSWQIKRILDCVLWNTQSGQVHMHTETLPLYVDNGNNPHEIGMESFRDAFLDVQHIQGRDSVLYALEDVGMILSSHSASYDLEWTQIDGTKTARRASDTLFNLSDTMDIEKVTMSRIDLCSGLFQVGQDLPRRLHSTVPTFGQDAHDMVSMIAFRSSSWSDDCPRFCLFVLSQEYPSIEGITNKLLTETVTLKNFFGERDFQWSNSDWQMFFSWRRALRNEI